MGLRLTFGEIKLGYFQIPFLPGNENERNIIHEGGCARYKVIKGSNTVTHTCSSKSFSSALYIYKSVKITLNHKNHLLLPSLIIKLYVMY